jgi:hypothetical protein
LVAANVRSKLRENLMSASAVGVGRGVVGADDLVASVDQPGDEPGADGAAGSGDEDSHRKLLVTVAVVGGSA